MANKRVVRLIQKKTKKYYNKTSDVAYIEVNWKIVAIKIHKVV